MKDTINIQYLQLSQRQVICKRNAQKLVNLRNKKSNLHHFVTKTQRFNFWNTAPR